MSRTTPILAGAATLGTAVMLLTGCTSSPQEDVSTACTAAAAHGAALKSFQESLSPDATVEQVKAARDEVQKTYDDMVDAAEEVSQDRANALEQAWDELDKAVEDIPDDATLQQAADSLKNEAADVESARSDVASELNCT
jgi:L-alanine-DL-glutamate epimerase-like enolase superfamily enzyme